MCERRLDLGGTNIAMAALQRGEIDLYPEYTGTALLDVLQLPADGSEAARRYATVKRAYSGATTRLARRGADERHAGARDDRARSARAIGLRTLSDVAAAAPDLRFGAVPEFVKRADGLPGLQRVYGGFHFKEIRLVDFGLKYAALLDGDVDVVVAFSTDGAIAADELVVHARRQASLPGRTTSRRSCAGRARRAPQIAPILDALSRR